MSYRDSLTKAQNAYVDDIVGQIPETMGARAAFINILDQLAEKPAFRYIIAGDGDVVGTNDQEKADSMAASQEHYVIDTQTSMWVTDEGESKIVRMK